MGWFFTGQLFDVFSTYYAIDILKLTESNPLAKTLFDTVGMDQFMMAKLFMSAVLIALYLISLKKINRWRWVLEKSLQIGSIGIWTVVSLNALMIALTI